ncbi:hypothetical protein KAZ01_00965 [Candidatus Gracilibacteria bacterium]|nr:hypothetical protein [Candidatus Gracilibacteria bacterium]
MKELKEWLKNREKSPRNIKELANLFENVPYKTVAGWIYQDKIPKDEKIRKKLYDLTGINKYSNNNKIELKTIKSKKYNKEVFRQIIINETETIINELLFKLSLLKNENKKINIRDKDTLEYFIKLKNSIYTCLKLLIPLLNNEELRNKFRLEINKKDIALLSSFLEALLDEKKFNIWKMFQEIDLEKSK